MPLKEVLVIGSGRRVRETALPAFHRMRERFRVRRVFAKRAKSIGVEGTSYEVGAFADLAPGDLSGVELVYVAVAKDAVPAVLASLVRHDPGRFDLLIDTPVVRFRHFRHARLLDRFRSAFVAEDCIELPWIETVRAFVATGAVGEIARVEFHHSAYAYHATATAKALFGAERILRGRRRKREHGAAEREIRLSGGSEILLREPRDYATGHLVVHGTRGTITDDPSERASGHRLEPVDSDGACRGFRIGESRTALDPAECELMLGPWQAAHVTGRMEAMKRVGFLRLLRRLDSGRGAYPFDRALEDMVVDYYLERLGRYLATPFTDPAAPLARRILGALTGC